MVQLLRLLFPETRQSSSRGEKSYLLPAAVTTELGSSVFQSRPSLEQRSWLSLEPATADTSFSTSRNTDGSMLTCTRTQVQVQRAEFTRNTLWDIILNSFRRTDQTLIKRTRRRRRRRRRRLQVLLLCENRPETV